MKLVIFITAGRRRMRSRRTRDSTLSLLVGRTLPSVLPLPRSGAPKMVCPDWPIFGQLPIIRPGLAFIILTCS